MNVLIVNSGSSSVKFQLYEMPREKLLMKCKVVKNEHGKTDFHFKTKACKVTLPLDEFSYSEIFRKLINELVRPDSECLSSIGEVDVVGHRLIHGGGKETGCEIVTKELIAYMESSVSLAPLHYPANLEGIRTIQQLMPEVLQAGVFDTAFHHTMPPKAFLYGISPDWCYTHRIRRYGFHGTSHKYASSRACQLAGIPLENSMIVTCHLGSGASVAAVKNGKSVDTSMGFTPVEGLLMGSRCGDIDAGIFVHLQKEHQFSVSRIQNLINKEGGLLGLSGVSSDYRAVEEAAERGNTSAQTALDVYHYRVKKYIGAYAAALGGIDLLVFTGGVGENSSRAREEVCHGLQFLGIDLNTKKNNRSDLTDAVISKKKSPVAVAVVTANEELEIAREVADMVCSQRKL
jgi:acetate kinase